MIDRAVAWLRRQWFFVGLVATLASAAIAPALGRTEGPLAPERWRDLLVAGIFAISGFELRTSELQRALRDVRLHVFVQAFSLLVCPALFALVAGAFGLTPLSPALLTGIVILGCLPTTVTSGVAFTRASGGYEAGALFNATLGNLLGIAVTPLSILLLTGQSSSLPVGKLVADLGLQVAAPVAGGQALRILLRGKAQQARATWPSKVASALLLALIYFVFCDSLSRGQAVTPLDLSGALLLAALLHACAIGLALRASAWPGWRFSRAQRTAAVICSSQKTAALGVPIIAIMYPGHPDLGLMTLPLLVYHPLQLVVAGAAVGAWKRYNDAAPLGHTPSPKDA